jgi:hypothetical protein
VPVLKVRSAIANGIIRLIKRHDGEAGAGDARLLLRRQMMQASTLIPIFTPSGGSGDPGDSPADL